MPRRLRRSNARLFRIGENGTVPRHPGATSNRRAISSRRAISKKTGSNRLHPRGHSYGKTTGAKVALLARGIAKSRGQLIQNQLIQSRIVHPVPPRHSNLPDQNVRSIGEKAARHATVRRHPKAGREATGRQNVLSANARKKAGKILSFRGSSRTGSARLY